MRSRAAEAATSMETECASPPRGLHPRTDTSSLGPDFRAASFSPGDDGCRPSGRTSATRTSTSTRPTHSRAASSPPSRSLGTAMPLARDRSPGPGPGRMPIGRLPANPWREPMPRDGPTVRQLLTAVRLVGVDRERSSRVRAVGCWGMVCRRTSGRTRDTAAAMACRSAISGPFPCRLAPPRPLPREPGSSNRPVRRPKRRP